MYSVTKFDISSCSRLGCVFYTTMGSAAILNPRWRLFQHFVIFSWTTSDNTPLCQISYL